MDIFIYLYKKVYYVFYGRIFVMVGIIRECIKWKRKSGYNIYIMLKQLYFIDQSWNFMFKKGLLIRIF